MCVGPHSDRVRGAPPTRHDGWPFAATPPDPAPQESICRVLTAHGCPVAVSSYYAAVGRPPSARVRRDEQLAPLIAPVHADNYGVYGARKVWPTLNRQGTPVARCTAERLMKAAALQGVRR